MDDANNIIKEFLKETKQLVDDIENVIDETAIELYDMYHECVSALKDNSMIEPNIRVELSIIMDKILERIIDIPWFEINVDAEIYTPAVQGYRVWKNAELMKDKGLVGYMLGKEVGCKSNMFFCGKEITYNYLADLEGMKLIYTEINSVNESVYEEFLLNNYTKMDVLILHGIYNETIKFLARYRELRPDGIVYCGLDMNSYWMNRINWSDKDIRNFAKQCNVISTSSSFIRDKLNSNPDVSFFCRYLPNAYYNALNTEVIAEYKAKQNNIITVGRIGSKQKNNIELMIAFAEVAHKVVGWNLKFIGDIEEEFEEVIEEYFRIRPDLKDRVIFTGAITDKDKLYNEYSKAKIFALTSTVEGGTPNVYAEALFHGCMFITSNIDAAQEITNYGKLGMTYKLGDVEALQKVILEVCKKAEDETSLKLHIKDALEYANKNYDWERNIKKLAYQLFVK